MSASLSRPRTRTSLFALFLCAALLAVPGAAAAGEFKRDKAADVRAPGLKGAQKKALDIIGIDVTRTTFVARIVVRFKGNFEKQLRTRAMRKAGALIRVTPGQARAAASAFASPARAFAAAAPTTVASVGSGKQLRTLSSRRGNGVAAVRSGRELTFWIAGVNGIQLKNIQARSFDGRRRGGARRAQDEDEESPPPDPYAPQKLDELVRKPPADQLGFLQSVLQAPRVSTDCKRVRDLLAQVEAKIDRLDADLHPAHGDFLDRSKWIRELVALVRRAKAYLAGPPCFDPASQGGGGGGTGDGGTGGGGTGGGGTPGAPQCSNEVDDGDEEDLLVDFGPDPGCHDTSDNDEKDVTGGTGPNCGPPGTTGKAWVDVNTPTSNTIVGHKLVNAANGNVLHSESTAGHAGAVPIDIGCGAGITVTLEDGAGANAPNPGGSVPAPNPPTGEVTFRFLITITNPMGSGNAGNAVPHTVRGSINTRK